MSLKLASPASERNALPIIRVLEGVLPHNGMILELASGSGFHTAAFASHFRGVTWQPSDPDLAAIGSIRAYIAETPSAQILEPLRLDVHDVPWPVRQADAVLCINMIHISPWSATQALFIGASRILRAGAMLFTYGPYVINGDFQASTNEDFDRSLRERNPTWGLRDLNDVTKVAQTAGFVLENRISMPANNWSLIWRRIDHSA